MSDMKNIYDVLDEIGFENQCEKYALGFHRDTDTPTMTKFRQESMKQFCFSLIQQYAEKVYEDFIRTRKALDIRKKQVEIANKAFDFISTEWDNPDCSRKELGACAFNAKEDIAGWESDIETALEQKEHFADASKTIEQKDK